MSYIIAFVKFPETDAEYPVECFRTDLKIGDSVLIRQGNGTLKQAVLSNLKYLNWACKGRIECKLSEAHVDKFGEMAPPDKSPLHVGLATKEALVIALRKDGWTPLKPGGNVHNIILTLSNESQSANILFRKNGVDLQILPSKSESEPKAWSPCSHYITKGRLVRHYLAHTTFNLYEGVWRFSRSFSSNSNDYDRFFKSVGERDKRTAELKVAREGSELSDIYDAISDGSGQDAYLGDGVWIGSSGHTYDRGR